MNIVRFGDFIKEDIHVQDGELVFDYRKSGEGIGTKFGKDKNFAPYTKTIPGTDMKCYSLYVSNKAKSSEVLKAMKNVDYSNSDVSQFLNRSAVYATRVLRGTPIDIIVTPKSSSNLTKEFVKDLAARNNVSVMVDSFVKQPDISKIEIDRESPKISENIIKKLETILRKAKENNQFKLSKILPQHRKFIKNIFVVADESIIKKINDKNVLIVDDIITEGTTSESIYNILVANGAKFVTTLTVFKSDK